MGNTHGFSVARRQRPQMMASWELRDHESSRSHGTEVYNLTRFLSGDHLESIMDHSARYGDSGTVELYNKPLVAACHHLMGYPHEPCALDQSEDLHRHTADNLSAELWVLFFRVFVATFMNDYESANTSLEELKRAKRSHTVPLVIENHMIFYQGIVAAVQATRGDSRRRRRNLASAQKRLRKLRTERADEDPTLWNKVFLLEAQIHVCNGQHENALLLFHKSVELADREGFSHEQGLAYELAYDMCRGCGRTGEADLYLSQAQANYGRWGAHVKVEQLDQRTSSHSQSTQSRGSCRSSSVRSSRSRSQSSMFSS